MKLSEILKICSENEVTDFRYSVVCGDTESQVTGITSDSRKMQDGYAFVCIKGAVSDGHKYIPQVIQKKAGVIVIQDSALGNDETASLIKEIPSGKIKKTPS